jgi:hypothetical protein
MAKAGTLAGLAALAGAAYLNRDKLFGSKDTTDSNATRAARPESTETREEPLRQMTGYMKKAPADAESNMQTDMLKAITAPKASPNDQASNQGVLSPKSLTPKSPVKDRKVLSPEEGMRNYKPRYTPSAMAPKTSQGATYEKKPYMPEDVDMGIGRKRGGAVKMASGGMTASRRADGIAKKGKTRCKIC